jgi:hypothetical protein
MFVIGDIVKCIDATDMSGVILNEELEVIDLDKDGDPGFYINGYDTFYSIKSRYVLVESMEDKLKALGF